MAAIVCGVDGSAPSRAAARLSAALARRLGLALVLEHALSRAGDRVDAQADRMISGRSVRAALARDPCCRRRLARPGSWSSERRPAGGWEPS